MSNLRIRIHTHTHIYAFQIQTESYIDGKVGHASGGPKVTDLRSRIWARGWRAIFELRVFRLDKKF